MCTTCGCSDGMQVTYTDPSTGETSHTHGGHAHDHSHPHDHDHDHDHAHVHDHDHHPAALHAEVHGRTVTLEQDLLAKNQLLAERNRGWFEGREVVALNLMSSPGSGKTSLLERTIAALKGTVPVYVVEGDQATTNDAERIRATGCPVIQVNTGTGCHLEADMLARGVARLKPERGSLILIENVGNLVCPALFDLGETGQGGDPVGHGRRGQAGQVSSHVPGVRGDAHQQDRPSAARAVRCRTLHRLRTPDESWDPRLPGVGGDRRGDGGVVRVAAIPSAWAARVTRQPCAARGR